MPKKIGTAIAAKSVVGQVVDQITDAIINGTLKPGDRLPTEPELCETFQVGRNSIREAIKILEAYGVVYIKRPDGTFVNDTYSQKMLDPMLYGILLQKDFTSDIIQLRKVLDVGILQTLTPAAQPEELKTVRTAFEQLRDIALAPAADSEKLMQADMDFHLAVTSLSHNQLLLRMYTYVDRITIPSRLKTITAIIENGETEQFVTLHRHLLELLEGGQRDIEETINEHYSYWKQNGGSNDKTTSA